MDRVSGGLRHVSQALTAPLSAEGAEQTEPMYAQEDIKELDAPSPYLVPENMPKVSMKISHEEPDARTGGMWTCVFHIITAVIGAGILALPNSVAQLGWIAGIILMILFAYVTLITSQLLADCHVIDGVRQRTYADLVYTCFGKRGYIFLVCLQHSNLLMTALAYHITATTCFQAIAQSICSSNGTPEDTCFTTYWKWAIIFGALQMIVVQMPDLNYFWWASIVGAVMSFSYSSIALGLSISKGNSHMSSLSGPKESVGDKYWSVANALGAILFAYSFSMILVEIQDTVKDRPGVGVVRPMRRAVIVSVCIMTSFYLTVSVAGYCAFGDDVPGNILHGFTSPKWVIDWANVMVIIHLVPAYQLYSQPFVSFVEELWNDWERVPKWCRGIVFRLIDRSIYIVVVTVLACCLPFFGDIVGLVGAIGFWPLSVLFPIECWIKCFKPTGIKLILLRIFNVLCCLVTIVALMGSIQLIVVDSSDYTVFSN